MTAAILTKYLGPTNHRGGRVKASVANSTDCTVMPWDHALSESANHAGAALALARTMNWPGSWQGGSTLDGYAFVLTGAGPGFLFNH